MSKYEPQEIVMEKDAEYGIIKYTPDQLSLHEDVMELLKSKRYKAIPADHCMVVFGRVYSVYAISQLKQEGKIKIIKCGGGENDV